MSPPPEETAAPAAARPAGVLGAIERLGDRLPDPVMIFVWLILAVFALSMIGAAAGWQAVNPVSQQTLHAASLLSSSSIERLLVEMPRTLTGFAPLGYVLLVMLGAGLAERTGLFAAAMRAAVRWAPQSLLTPMVLFAGIMGNQAADAAFVILPPLAAALYAAAGRHPLLGIAVAFAGVAGGFSANLVPGQLDALLLGISEPAARLLVPDWRMNVAGNWYFIAAMTFLFVPLGWWVTEQIRRAALRHMDGPGPRARGRRPGAQPGGRASRAARGGAGGVLRRRLVRVAGLARPLDGSRWRRAALR